MDELEKPDAKGKAPAQTRRARLNTTGAEALANQLFTKTY